MIKIVDISHWNELKDAVSLATKVNGVFAKATDGASYTDQTFAPKIQAARDAGMFTGAYHFFRPLDDPEQQASLFSVRAGVFSPLGLAVDLEPTQNPNHPEQWAEKSVDENCTAVLKFLSVISQKWKGLPYIYTTKFFMETFLKGLDLSNYPLWVADYNQDHVTPTLPPFWKGWDMWQCNEHDSEPGIVGDDDLDVFNGGLDKLKASVCNSIG